MSRISKVFENNKVFISFLTAGDPTLEKTEEFVLALAEAGSDIIIISIPFSDSASEGELIERSNMRALNSGARTDKIFGMIKKIRLKNQIPLIFSTYMNPVFVYGIDKFLQKCSACGIDALIIPDLPFEERSEVADISRKYGIYLITIITPSSKERIQYLAKDAAGFIHLVLPNATETEAGKDINSIITSIRNVSKTPIAAGLDIKDEEAKKVVDGVITGSAIVKLIEQYGENAATHLFEYVKNAK